MFMISHSCTIIKSTSTTYQSNSRTRRHENLRMRSRFLPDTDAAPK